MKIKKSSYCCFTSKNFFLFIFVIKSFILKMYRFYKILCIHFMYTKFFPSLFFAPSSCHLQFDMIRKKKIFIHKLTCCCLCNSIIDPSKHFFNVPFAKNKAKQKEKIVKEEKYAKRVKMCTVKSKDGMSSVSLVFRDSVRVTSDRHSFFISWILDEF